MIVPKKQTANANVEGGGGLFNGETGPAIPPVVYVPGALEGMKVGGRRIIKNAGGFRLRRPRRRRDPSRGARLSSRSSY